MRGTAEEGFLSACMRQKWWPSLLGARRLQGRTARPLATKTSGHMHRLSFADIPPCCAGIYVTRSSEQNTQARGKGGTQREAVRGQGV